MNREDILRMAREAGIPTSEVVIKGNGTHLRSVDIERFFHAAYAAGAAAEREACAKVCYDKANETFSGHCQVWGDYFARAIRARENT